MLCRLNGKLEIRPKFGAYLQDLRLILTKRLLYLIGFAANTGNSSISHTFNIYINSLSHQIIIFERKNNHDHNHEQINRNICRNITKNNNNTKRISMIYI